MSSPPPPIGREEVPEVCLTCRYGRGPDRRCVLLEAGDQTTLFEKGPCRLPERIEEEAKHLLHRRYPFARTLEEDIASEVLLHVIETKHLLVPASIRHLPPLLRRVHEVVRTAVIDGLRHHHLVTRVRCGSCTHFEGQAEEHGCRLEYLPPRGGDILKNPHFGPQVDRASDPRALDPPCEAFEWRRPEMTDLFAEKIPGMDPEGTPRERAIAVVVQAIDRLSRQGESGMRAASVVFWHHLRGRSVAELSTEARVSEKTIKRILAFGRERLLEILTSEFAVANLDEIL